MTPTPEGVTVAARVIVADDEALIRMGLRRMLEDAGHTVVGEAATADEVFDLAQGHSADVVLLDIRMPGMDTLQAARSLAKDQSMPVVFVSAFSDPDMVARATETGAFAYIVKPVRVEQLLAAIAVATARSADLRRANEALQTRKVVERAKGLLMKQLNLGEEAAHLLLQRQSRNLRKSVRDVAEAILRAEIHLEKDPPRQS